MADGTLSKILYVEDEPDIQEVARMALEMVGGYTVTICSSGEEAIATAPGFDPDLLILDVMMPGMDGPTTLSELRKIDSLANKPAIFLTAKVQPQEVAEYKEMGAIDVIPKPFDTMSLSATVLEIWSSQIGD